MKKLLLILLPLLAACSANRRDTLPLSGEWRFSIDSLDRGVEEQWFLKLADETINLPGSMAENGKGNVVTVNTHWTGDIIDRSWFTEPFYARYREPGNIKIPFWLQPVRYYAGPAWYQREFEVPSGWEKKNVLLYLERPHWETTVFINGKNAGSSNSLAVPHQYDITAFLREGVNLLSIRVDNSIKVPIGVNSHSISDHTQSNWNGIAGDISLKALPRVFIDDVAVYPDPENRKAKILIRLSKMRGEEFKGKLRISAESFNSSEPVEVKGLTVDVDVATDDEVVTVDYPMGEDVQLWSEYEPSMYRLNVTLRNRAGRMVDSKAEDFGMRRISVEGTRIAVNGEQVFLRGTTECCIFPLTGYPPCDTAAWSKIFRTCIDHGLNHMRFHSFCPPEAAFIAADRLGIYLHVECSSWANQGATIGDGTPADRFIYNEGDRIIREYGNHPSFCMLAYGNEPAGRNHKEYLGNLLNYWKDKDDRRIYTSAAGWPDIPENEYHLLPGPRIQQWGDGLKSIINSQPPRSDYDHRGFLAKHNVPVVGHETGQWCVYPDFSEIEKYTGPLKPENFKIFRETLIAAGMGDQAHDFLMASGKLQALCYKAEIEAALRTPGFAGFQILQLHDFPGQGTALVGILNPFFGEKGYITPEEFRMFCNETVPLARMKKMVFRSDEQFEAGIEIAHFGQNPIRDASVTCKITDSTGNVLFTRDIPMNEIPRGNCIQAGSISFGLEGISSPQKLKLDVSVNGQFRNSWDFWVYPEEIAINSGKVHVTSSLDRKAEDILAGGGSVLLLNYGKVPVGKGAEIQIGFSSIFWNTAWTKNQAPHTLGILCDPGHPVFGSFPTEYHSNWQWWDPVAHSQAMILDELPEVKPLIQPIDTWFSNRKLGLAFEVSSGGGKIIVCSIDLKDPGTDRIVSRQLLASVLDYMNSRGFNPSVKVDIQKLKALAGRNN